MRIGRRLLMAGVGVVALAGHVAYWYLPRDRAALVDANSPAGELFVGGAQEVRLWLAYPHQNLGAAARAMDDPVAAIEAASRLAGVGKVSLPAFGPFTLPPADALAIAVDPAGENLAVAIEVYPTIAVLARLAGLVAGNPVLRGGSLLLSGRRVRVAWRGRSWSMVTEGVAAPGVSPGGAVPSEAGLAFVTLSRRLGVAEPGAYRLRLEGSDLVLSSDPEGGSAALAELAEAGARERDLAFLGLRVEGSDGWSVLVMPRSGATGLRLPDAAVAWTGGDRRFALPAERILRLLGIHPLTSSSGPWSVVAIDRPSLEIASVLAPELGAAAGAARATLVLWVRPRDYLPLVSAISGVLDALPIAPRDETRHWHDLRTVLEAIGPVDRLRATLTAGGAEARLGWGEPYPPK